MVMYMHDYMVEYNVYNDGTSVKVFLYFASG